MIGVGINDFEGSDYDPGKDKARLTGQILRVYDCMIDGEWRTLAEVEGVTSDPQASISAQLRHLRKDKWGGYILNKRRRGDGGTWEYQLLSPEPIQEQGQLNMF